MLDFNSLRMLLKALRTVHGRALAGTVDMRGETFGVCTTVRDAACDLSKKEGQTWGERADVLHLWAVLRPIWFSTWAHYTGNPEYPVPCTDSLIRDVMQDVDEGELARLQYDKCSHDDSHWKGAQGELRIELLAHCINKITGLLPEGQVVS